MEPLFHENSYGYRKGKNSHQAVERALKSALNNCWAIDIDIKGFFDNIDHELLLKAVILEKLRSMKIHKMRTSIEVVSQKLSPIIRGWMNYYCKFWTGHTHNLWHQINLRLNKWVRWEKGLSSRSARRWIKEKYKVSPGLFPH